MNKKSLERLLSLEGTIGWLDDAMFTFFVSLFNISLEYDIEKKINSVLLSQVFGDTKDNVLKMDHSHCRKPFNLLKSDFTIKKNMPLESHNK